MANEITTRYCISGDQEELDSLYDAMLQLKESASSPNLRSLRDLFKIVDPNYDEESEIGLWDKLEKHPFDVSFTTYTENEPCPELASIMTEKYESLMCFYLAYDECMGSYWTNDEEGDYFPYEYAVSIHTPNRPEEVEFFEDMESAFEWISQGLEEPIASMEDVEDYNEALAEEDEDYHCSVHEIERSF